MILKNELNIMVEDNKLSRKALKKLSNIMSKSLLIKSKSMKNMPYRLTPPRYRLKPSPVVITPADSLYKTKSSYFDYQRF